MSDDVPRVVLWRFHDAPAQGTALKLYTRSNVHRWLRPRDVVMIMACGKRARQQNVGIDAVLVVQDVRSQKHRGCCVHAAVVSRPSTRREWFGRLKKYQMPHLLTADEVRVVEAYQPCKLLPQELIKAQRSAGQAPPSAKCLPAT